jgi:RNA polymerase sigma factor (sigma-70 family)
MASASAHPIIRYVRHLAASHFAAALPDAQLLERYVVRRDESAFAALVRRHGPLVLGACRRVLADPHAAEDAFQATFLVLARKAGRVRRPESLGAWLYGVATRTALKVRARQARNRRVEERAALNAVVRQADDLVWRDLRPVLDEAVAGLPEQYRVPFVLHHLEGATVAETARRLGCPPGTVAARLARAKERLRSRLSRKGVTLSAGALAVALSGKAAAASVPVALAAGAVEAAMLVAAGEAAVSSTAFVALTKGVIQAMTMTKLKVAALLLAVSAVGVGAVVSRHRTGERAGRGTADVSAVAEAESPTAERYYAGGFRTTRGFEFRGGDFQFLNSIEYQVPVRADDRCYAVGFVDSGTVESKAEIEDYCVSAGRGLRIKVPMLGPVPVALDFGFPIIKPNEAGNREQVFNFWLGFVR